MTEIDWGALTMRTGKAAQVGQALEKLRSTDAELRRAGLATLEESLYQQKEWFSAGLAAIPVLGAMASDSGLEDRHRFLALVTNIVTSDHRGLIATGFDRDHEPLKPILSKKGAVTAVTAATRETPRWQGFLTEAEPRIRAAAAFLLAFLPDSASTSIPLLEGRVGVEEEPFARSSLLLSLGILGIHAEPKTRERIAATLSAIAVATNEPALVRGVAALCLLYFAPSGLPASFDPLLIELLLMGDLGSDRWPWIFGRIDALVSRLLIDRAGDGPRAASLLTEAIVATHGRHALASEWYNAVGELTMGPMGPIPMPAELSAFQRQILTRLADFPQTARSLRNVPMHPMDYRCWLGLEPPAVLEQEVDFSLAGHSGRGPLWKLASTLSRKPFDEAVELMARVVTAPALLSAAVESQYKRYNFALGNLGEVAELAERHTESDWAVATAEAILRLRPELEPGSRYGVGKILLSRLPASLTGSGEYLDEPWDRLVPASAPDDLLRQLFARLRPEKREPALLGLLERMVDNDDVNQRLVPTLAALVEFSPSARVVQGTLDLLELLLRWGSIDDEAAAVFPALWQRLEAMATANPELRSILEGWPLTSEQQARLEKAKQGETYLD